MLPSWNFQIETKKGHIVQYLKRYLFHTVFSIYLSFPGRSKLDQLFNRGELRGNSIPTNNLTCSGNRLDGSVNFAFFLPRSLGIRGFFSGSFPTNTGDILNQGHLGFQVAQRLLNGRLSQHSWVNMPYVEHLQIFVHQVHSYEIYIIRFAMNVFKKSTFKSFDSIYDKHWIVSLFCWYKVSTLPKPNIAPLKNYHPQKDRILFQPAFFQGSIR